MESLSKTLGYSDTSVFAKSLLDYILFNSPIILFSADREGLINYVSGKSLDALGLDPSTMKGTNFVDYAWTAEVSEPDGSLRSLGPAEVLELVLVGKEISSEIEFGERFFSIRISPSRSIEGEISGIVGVAIDVTDRKEAQDSLEKRTIDFKTVIGNLPVVVFSISTEGKILLSEGNGLKRLGLEPKDIAGKTVYERAESRPEVIDAFNKALQGEESIYHSKINGLYIETRMYPRFGKKRKVEEILGIMYDISDRLEYEAMIRFNLAVISQVNDAIIALDADQRITYYNKYAAKLYEVGESDCLGKHYTSMFKEDWISDENYRAAMKDWETIGASKRELIHTLSSGKKISIESNFKKIIPDGFVSPGLIMVNRDITEKKETNESLEAALRGLEKTNKELEQFAYIASHDLQEPLRTIASYLQLLERKFEKDIKPEMKEFIRVSVDAAKRQQVLIESLLSYSRVGSASVKKTRIDPEEILEEVERDLGSVIRETRTRLIFEGPFPNIYADPEQIHRLFSNLISNAIKFRSPKRTPLIEVSVKEVQGALEFCVSDNGIGMDAKYFDRIFIIFQKLHANSEYPGTGIGLSICKKIVENHGGKIWVRSLLGSGSEFFFTLPEV
ncbi:PAS domain S-box protein [Leptospira langatensis]|uniref:histidine kinase n=1 Tax=Leptospira langatensis TaxID=2484983 RepID=A0A5F1ZZK3_9LEPT|nr:ATP-binding protein [Leptospira langatensis]TGJ98522.1 PAS domain S-box protein [Leptospira langatensis]TGL43437.1 PAS domain S-box protein [Leptospira langatensis]